MCIVENPNLNSLLHERQFDFRRHISAEHAVSYVVFTIKDMQSNYTLVTAVSFDIKGAFDHLYWNAINDKFNEF